MRRSMPLLAVCFAVAFTVPVLAQSSANSDICAADDDSAFSPEQRVAACTAVIADGKDAPPASAFVNRGRANWYMNKMQAGFADFDRAIALDPKNARAFRERSNAFRSSGRLDRALADAVARQLLVERVHCRGRGAVQPEDDVPLKDPRAGRRAVGLDAHHQDPGLLGELVVVDQLP